MKKKGGEISTKWLWIIAIVVIILAVAVTVFVYNAYFKTSEKENGGSNIGTLNINVREYDSSQGKLSINVSG